MDSLEPSSTARLLLVITNRPSEILEGRRTISDVGTHGRQLISTAPSVRRIASGRTLIRNVGGLSLCSGAAASQHLRLQMVSGRTSEARFANKHRLHAGDRFPRRALRLSSRKMRYLAPRPDIGLRQIGTASGCSPVCRENVHALQPY